MAADLHYTLTYAENEEEDEEEDGVDADDPVTDFERLMEIYGD